MALDLFTKIFSPSHAGSTGVAWAIVWFLVVKNSPSEDPKISEEERLYIESALANDIQKKVCT